jgi:hypothetical protein
MFIDQFKDEQQTIHRILSHRWLECGTCLLPKVTEKKNKSCAKRNVKAHQPGEVTSHAEFLCYLDQFSMHFCNIL